MHEAALTTKNKRIIKDTEKISIKIADAVAQGYLDVGAMCYEDGRQGKHLDDELEWWAQVEAVVDFLNVYTINKAQIKKEKEERHMSALKSENQRSVSISSQLYNELRGFCDQIEISFLDFVEESLEAATRRYELEELLNDEAKIKEKIRTEQRQAYLDGFERGVLVSLAALNGQLTVSQKLTPHAVRDKPRYRVVTGEQMKLF